MSKQPCVGYTLLSYASDVSPLLVDMDGNEVHRWPIPGSWVRMLSNGSLLGSKRMREDVDPHRPAHLPRPPAGRPGRPVADRGGPPAPPSFDTIEFVQMSWEDEEEWSFSEWDDDGIGVMMSRQHHDCQREGNPVGYYAPGQDFVPQGKTLILGHKTLNVPEISPLPLMDDAIYEVDWDGNLTGFRWFGAEHVEEIGLDDSARRDLQRVGSSEPESVVVDWLHLNTTSVLGPNRWYDEHGDERFHPDNIMISSRGANFIAIVSRATGALVWRAGPDFVTGKPESAVGQLVGQHHPHIIPLGLPGAGNVLLFDNGGHSGYGGPNGYPRYKRDYWRVVEFNPLSFEIAWEYQAKPGQKDFFSHNISSAQRLPNGDTLIDEGARGRVFEVDREGDIVWELIAQGKAEGQNHVYRAYRIPPEWVPGNPAGYTEWRRLYE